MRLCAILLLPLMFGPTQAAEAADWYISVDGSDTSPGTLKLPFGTLGRAQTAASSGDTVYVRGGRYEITESQIAERKGIFARVIVLDKSGKPDRPITYRAYENERPVFDFSAVKPAGLRVSAFYVSGSWLRVVGLDVTGVQVTIRDRTQSICFESQGSHNVFERLSMHDGQAIGIYHVRGSDNVFLNCDAWNNHDHTSEDGKGENVDGFGCHPTRGSTGNVFRGCRAWFNSDDGFDTIGAHEPVTIEHCWAFYNGYSTEFESLANGNGFKVGGYGSWPRRKIPSTIPRHVVRRCIAVRNKANGFYANHHPGGCDWFNNTAHRNGTEFNMLGRKSDHRTDVDGYGHKLLNNLGYGSRRQIVSISTDACELANNSFTLDLKLNDRDFVSLDQSQLRGPRGTDGSLPKLTLLRPANGSRLIDAGVAVDEPFSGKAPDIGALEHAGN